MVRELLPVIDGWRQEGVGFGRAVLVRAFGSAPRPEGATLLVTDDGRIAGSVSGGCVEGACVQEVARARADGRSRVLRYGISDETAWDVGLACGSTIDVLVEAELRPEIESAARSPGSAVVTPLPAGSPGPEDGRRPPGVAPPAPVVSLTPGGETVGSLGQDELDGHLTREARLALAARRSATVGVGERQYFVEVFPVPPRLVVFGAVQVAFSLVRLAHELGYRTVVVDARAAFATRERFPDADELLVGWPDEVASRLELGPDDAVAVLTHDPKLDEPAIVAALRAGCGYVGAIGSRRTQAARRRRLAGAGLGDAELARLRGPIGLDLRGRQPAETALSILAEVVAVRHGASGGPMRERVAAEGAGTAVT